MAAPSTDHDMDDDPQVGDLLERMKVPLAAFITDRPSDHTGLAVLDLVGCPSLTHSINI
jgi:hypothetical protein